MSVKPIISTEYYQYVAANINGLLFNTVDDINKTTLFNFMIMGMGFDIDLIWTIKQPLNRYEHRWSNLKNLSIAGCIILPFVLVLTSNGFIPLDWRIWDMHT